MAAAMRLSPSGHLNYRANIDVLKRAGVTDVLSLSAVGSLKEELPPGDFVIVDQFIDRSFAREKSFFGNGCVAHVSMADPVCPRLGDALRGGRGPARPAHPPAAAATWSWKARNSRPGRKASCIEAGAAASSA